VRFALLSILMVYSPAHAEVSAVPLPQNVAISCPPGGCPQGIGVILFATKGVLNGYECAGTLVGLSEVHTSSHCVPNDRTGGWFFYLNNKNKVQSVKLTTVILQKRLQGGDTIVGLDSDAAVISTTTPVADANTASLATWKDDPPDTLNVYFLDKGKNLQFSFRREICKPQTNALPMSVRPESYRLTGCSAAPGNSASPMFNAKGKLEAILIGNDPINAKTISAFNDRCLISTASKFEISGCAPVNQGLFQTIANEQFHDREDRFFYEWKMSEHKPVNLEWQELTLALNQTRTAYFLFPKCADVYLNQTTFTWPIEYRVASLALPDSDSNPHIVIKAGTVAGRIVGGKVYFTYVVDDPSPLAPTPDFVKLRSQTYALPRCSK
jgi:hypothetical protein